MMAAPTKDFDQIVSRVVMKFFLQSKGVMDINGVMKDLTEWLSDILHRKNLGVEVSDWSFQCHK